MAKYCVFGISLLWFMYCSAGVAPTVSLQEFMTGLASPLGVRHAGDASNRLFVIEQGGRIRVIDAGGSLLAAPFLDISSISSSGGERGLLGLAFHPNYPGNGWFYVNYTDNSGDTVVARYTVSVGDANIANPASAQTVIAIDQDFSNHNGGDLHFGPDGYLYIGMGDGGDGGDPLNRAQNRGQLLGKMLRIDVDNPGINPAGACGPATNYGIPADNPFVGGGDGACDEIWALGLRNPYRFNFDRMTGDMWIADVGQGNWEEVDFQPVTSSGGENYGWDCREGAHVFSGPPNGPAPSCPASAVVDPVMEYNHAGRCSITGGYRYRGPWVDLDGLYFFGDYCSGEIFAGQLSGMTWSFSVVIDPASDPTSYCPGGFCLSGFGESESGELYVTELGGRIHRVLGTVNIGLILRDGFESP